MNETFGLMKKDEYALGQLLIINLHNKYLWKSRENNITTHNMHFFFSTNYWMFWFDINSISLIEKFIYKVMLEPWKFHPRAVENHIIDVNLDEKKQHLFFLFFPSFTPQIVDSKFRYWYKSLKVTHLHMYKFQRIFWILVKFDITNDTLQTFVEKILEDRKKHPNCCANNKLLNNTPNWLRKIAIKKLYDRSALRVMHFDPMLILNLTKVR